MQMINRHPPRDQFHLAKAKTPARRRSASRITSCPRILLVKSSWAFAPSTLLLLKISALDHRLLPARPPLRTTQHYYFCISRRTIVLAYQGRKSRQRRTAGVSRHRSSFRWTRGTGRLPAWGTIHRFAGEKASANPKIFRGHFASVLHFFIAHLGTLIEVAQAGSFHGRGVHKHVLAAVIGLNKSISLSCIEPLHNTCRHVSHSLEKQ
jgi:hypothetical protein